MPKNLEDLRPSELDGLDRDKTVFLFRIGEIQDFGPHIPVGIGLKKVRYLAQKWATSMEEKLPDYTVVFLPEATLSTQNITHRYSLRSRGFVLRDYIVDSCRSLAKQGFRHFFCWTSLNTPKQITAIEEASITLNKPWAFLHGVPRLQVHCINSHLVNFSEAKHQLLWPDPKEHGGQVDSSIALLLCPDLTDPRLNSYPPFQRQGSSLQKLWQRFRGQVRDYWGDPSQASSEKGEQHLLKQVQSSLNACLAVLRGAPPSRLFRSPYSLVPFNWSYLYVWVLSLSIVGLFFLWMVLFFSALGTW